MGLLRNLFGRPPYVSGNPNAESLTGAGYRVTHASTDQVRRLIQPWQARAFSYYDQLGEIKYASQFYSRMLSPLRLYPAKLDDNGDWVEIPPDAGGDDAFAVAALDRIQDPGGGRESLLGSYGRLMFLTGEGYLLCSRNGDTGDEQWEMLSTDELRIQSGTYVRYRAPSLAAENLREISDDDFEPIDDASAVAYRLWKRHPRYSQLADSTMMGVLELCEELIVLTRVVRSRARSRLAGSGILAISEDFSHGSLEATPDEDIDLDPFLSDLRDAMLAPITNEGAASAVVPIVVRGSTEAVEKGIKHIQIVDPTQLYPETGLRTECIHRIALGLDMPPEILEGLQDSNHWTAWQISEDTWQGHGQPIANQLVADLNAAYFRPQLRQDGVVDYRRYGIAYDATAIVNKPDKTKNAQELFALRSVGKKYLREAHGVDEDAAPTQDELNEMIGIATRDSSLAVYGIPSIKAGGLETEPGVVEAPGEPATGTPEAADGASAEPGPPNSGEQPEAVTASSNGHARKMDEVIFVTRIAGAADLALARAREAAGNRLRSLAKKDADLLELIADVPARDVAATLGPDRVKALGVTERDLVASARILFVEALRMYGIAEDAKVTLVVDQIERHALRTLYDLRPAPLPPQFETYVAGVLERAT